jgi:pimeloyl-ACP methyl ester carboxylesterase
VLVHGYGGSGVIFYKMMKSLSDYFHLILIDVIGMGGSSRPTFEPKTPTECDEYFIETLELWRVAMDNLTDFILAGHSFGGYICGHYAVKYH